MAGPSGLHFVSGALPVAAHFVQRYGNTPQAVLSPVSVPLFWATWPPLGLDGHGVAPPSDRSIAIMALMPSTELTSTASLPMLMANSPLVTPHGPPEIGHDCGGARNVTAPVARAPLNEFHDTVWLACSVKLPCRPEPLTGTFRPVLTSTSLASSTLPFESAPSVSQAVTGLPVALENCSEVNDWAPAPSRAASVITTATIKIRNVRMSRTPSCGRKSAILSARLSGRRRRRNRYELRAARLIVAQRFSADKNQNVRAAHVTWLAADRIFGGHAPAQRDLLVFAENGLDREMQARKLLLKALGPGDGLVRRCGHAVEFVVLVQQRRNDGVILVIEHLLE